jgi:hypothetical protein
MRNNMLSGHKFTIVFYTNSLFINKISNCFQQFGKVNFPFSKLKKLSGFGNVEKHFNLQHNPMINFKTDEINICPLNLPLFSNFF